MADLATAIAATQVSDGKLALFWLGGAGFVFRTAAGRTVAIDPYLSDSLDHYYFWKRLPLSPIALPARALQNAMVMLNINPTTTRSSSAWCCWPPSRSSWRLETAATIAKPASAGYGVGAGCRDTEYLRPNRSVRGESCLHSCPGV